jgi:hypothetical protein
VKPKRTRHPHQLDNPVDECRKKFRLDRIQKICFHLRPEHLVFY